MKLQRKYKSNHSFMEFKTLELVELDEQSPQIHREEKNIPGSTVNQAEWWA